jgi:hypothetical protein
MAERYMREIHGKNADDGKTQEGFAVVCVWKNFRNA